MPDEKDRRQLADARPVIESASGTTSPDNANSGNGAYVVFGVVVAVLVFVVMGLSSCVSTLSDLAFQQNAEAHGSSRGYFGDFFGQPDEDVGYGYDVPDDHYDHYDARLVLSR